jgi:hypothetical protein
MEGNERKVPHGEEADAEAWQRLSAYAYLSAPERLEYVAVMRVFCGTLLADLSVSDLLAKLAEKDAPGASLDAETLTRRLEELVRWGNLLRSTHTVKATSITEYQRSRSRYQLSKLGERVQRGADEVLAGADAAREASSELLVLVDRGLREIAAMAAAPGGADPQQALERISTLFVQFAEFAESVRDFYAYQCCHPADHHGDNPSQRRPAPHRVHPAALRSPHPGVLRTSHPGGQDPTRDHPLPQAICRPRGLQPGQNGTQRPPVIGASVRREKVGGVSEAPSNTLQYRFDLPGFPLRLTSWPAGG